MSDATDKARALRIKRLASMLSMGLSNAASAVDALIAELQIGEDQLHLWEGMHAAAAEGGKEQELVAAYQSITRGNRFSQLPPAVQAKVQVHAADFALGIMGDADAAECYLLNALSVLPDDLELFQRFEKKYEALDDKRKLLELYAAVGKRPPVPAVELGGKATNLIVPLSAKNPLSEEACSGLGALAPASPSLLDAIEAHLRKTGRAALVAPTIEKALQLENVPDRVAASWRRRLVDTYIGEAKAPEKSVAHVEALLRRDPNDKTAREAVKKLVLLPKVGEQVLELMREVRRQQPKA